MAHPIESHYEKAGLLDRLKTALAAAGLSGRTLSVEELTPLDQFHVRGLTATSELADKLTLNSQSQVLDLGSGLGGPARYLAARFGCKVHGIDLTPSFVEAAQLLTKLCGLQDRTTFTCANALSLPFVNGTFDLVWTQHVAMNIADRASLYREIFRVLKPGGTFALYDVVAGANGPVHFPVPWARDPEQSSLLSPDAMAAALTEQGFRSVLWEDKTAAAIAWLDQRTASPGPPSALGLHIVNGPEFAIATANLARSLREGRAALLEAVLEKPTH